MSIEYITSPRLVLACYVILFLSVAPCLESYSRRASDISVKAKSVCEPSGPSGQRLPPVSIVTRSISTPPWMGC